MSNFFNVTILDASKCTIGMSYVSVEIRKLSYVGNFSTVLYIILIPIGK
jgi:hypothetical protein